MSVYFLREGDLIKIGFSTQVRARVRAIINGLRGKGELLGYMPGDRSIEKHFHQMFAADHEYGEWFRVSDKLLSVVATMTTLDPPKESHRAQDRLLMQEERYAEEGAYFIRTALRGVRIDDSVWDKLEASTSIPANRLKQIYDGTVCPITAGEYVVLRTFYDAAIGITPEDHLAAKQASEEWAEQHAKGRQFGLAAMTSAPELGESDDA